MSINNLVQGTGYSSDTQQIAPQQCYNVVNVTAQAPSSNLKIDQAVSISDLENQLGISVNVKGGFAMFSASATANYLKSAQEKDYSISLNYYDFSSSNMAVEIGGFGPTQALNGLGQSMYDNGNNPYFGITCGDQIVTSYQAGAALMMGLKLDFLSSEQKDKFQATAGMNFADIISATASIQKAVQDLNVSGQLSIQAFQLGGEPQYLTSVLNKDKSGDFFALTCNLSDLGNCTEAASGLLDYAKSNFSYQFSFYPPKNVYLIGDLFQYEPAQFYGITPPPSLVTPQVEAARMNIAEALVENQYYEEKFSELARAYPVPFDQNSHFYQSMINITNIVNNNLQAITSPQSNAINCYNIPPQCTQIAQNILSNVQSISEPDIEFLGQIKNFYTFQYDSLNFFWNGKEWKGASSPNPCISDQQFYNMQLNFSLPEAVSSYTQTYQCNGDACTENWKITVQSILANGNIEVDANWSKLCSGNDDTSYYVFDGMLYQNVSGLYFEAYQANFI